MAQTIVTDVVVVGAGFGGLMTALALAPRHVTVVAKAALGSGAASGWAQGGIAAAVGRDDDPSLHAADTLRAGAGLCDVDAVTRLVAEAPQGIAGLVDLGAPFDRDADGAFALGREAAHSRRRIVHAGGDSTGRMTLDALVAAVRRTPSINVLEHVVADDLLIDAHGCAAGVVVHADGDPDAVARILAHAVVFATGGIGRLYGYTTNPPEARGDGLAMAARAGARLVDCEFVQFHPTALDAGRDPMPLVSEAVRGEGATLIDASGHRFMLDVHPDAELAPRDVVARAVYAALRAGERPLLDARDAIGASFPQRFPTVFALCMESGIDPRAMPIPIAPAAHYHMGGIAVDIDGRTSIRNLWACGEVAGTGIHGANRLASNSLLEAIVYGRRIAADITGAVPSRRRLAAVPATPVSHGAATLDEAELRRLMYEGVGVVRERAGIANALDRLDAVMDPSLRNLATVARAVATAALAREESRGSHYRSDFPGTVESSDHLSLVLTDGTNEMAVAQ